MRSSVKVRKGSNPPHASVLSCGSRAREQALLVDSGESRLVERHDFDIVICVFLNDSGRVFVCVERVHEDERDIDVVLRVQVLDLSHAQVEESHSFAHFNDRFRAHTTHGRAETSIELQDGELVEDGGVLGWRECAVRHYLLLLGRLDLVPFAG